MKVMKRYIVALIYMALCMPLVSCDKEVQEQYGDSSAYLPISDMENLYPLGGTAKVSFTSDSKWTVTAYEGTNDEATKDKAEWLKFKNCTLDVEGNLGGVGTTDLEIIIDPYIDKDSILEKTDPREATIIFKSRTGDKETLKEFKVSQDRAYFKIVESTNDSTSERNDIDDNISFDWKEEERKYEVESNFNWKLNINDGSVDNATVKVDNSEWDPNKLYGIGTNKLSVKVEYNFKEKRNNEISFIPYKNYDTEAENDVLRRKLNVSQDYLYLKVVDSSIDDINDPSQHDASCPEDDCFTFDELGNEDVVDFYVVYEENLEDNYYIGMDTSVSGVDTSCFECDKDGESAECTEKTDGRTIRWQKYNAKFLKANPDFDNERIITYVIKPTGTNEPGACRKVDFVQDAYQFVIKENDDVVESEKVVANAGDAEYNFTLETHGEWTVSYPKDVTWALLTFRDADGDTIEGEDKGNDIEFSGNGNATIGVEVANRNLSFDLDNVLNLAFEASNIKEDYPQANAQKSVDLKQPKFEFGIFVNDGTKETNKDFNVSSHTTKEYDVLIESSGSWKIVEESAWVTFDGTSDGWGTTNEAGSLTFSPNENDYSRDFVLKVISKEHEGVKGYEDNYYRELTITQDEIKTNILKSKNGPSLDGDTLSYAAYKKSSSDRESSFYMECSAPWTLAQKPSWVTLSKGSDVLSVGDGVSDGEYYTISMVVDNNFGTQSQNGNVSFSVGGKTIGFNVNQDGFVFDVPAFNKTYKPITTDAHELNIKLTNEAELDLSDIDDWVNLIEKGTEDNGDNTTTYKYLVKPGPNVENLNEDQGDGYKNEDRGRVYNIRVVGTSLTDSITIKQDKFEWELSTNELKFDVIGDKSQSVTITCTKEGSERCYDVDFENCKDWLKLSEDTKIGNNLLRFETTSTNTNTASERRGTITFYVKHSSIDEKKYKLSTINVEQEKYTWSVDYSGKTNFEPVYSKSSDYEGTIAIESSGKWKASRDNNDMVDISPSSGSSGKSVKFTIKPNHTRSVRTAIIEITNDDLGEDSKESFTFTQKAYVFEAEKESVKLKATKNSTASVPITSSGSKGWTFEVDPVSSDDWLDVQNEDGKLVVKTKSTTKKERYATITVTDNTSGLKLTIDVTQEG